MTKHTWRKTGSKNRKSETTTPPTQPPRCPECTSQKVWKDGIRHTRHSEVQRWLCRDCGFRFSEGLKQPHEQVDVLNQTRRFQPGSDLTETAMCNPNLFAEKIADDLALPFRKDVGSHAFTIIGKTLNGLRSQNDKRQVCVTEKEAKNLATTRQKEKRAAGATKPDPATIKGKLVEYSWYLKKQGYANGSDGEESTVQKRTRILERLVKLGANLWNPENVKDVIARQENWGDGMRIQAKYAYESFLQMEGMTWIPPTSFVTYCSFGRRN